MSQRQAEASFSIVLGRDWRREIEHEVLQADDPLEHVVDVIDIVLDGRNITSQIAKDRVLTLLIDLLEASLALMEGTWSKRLVSFPEEPWEIALVARGEDVLLSLYGQGPDGELVVRNTPVPARLLLAESAGAAAEILETVEQVFADDLFESRYLAHGVEELAALLGRAEVLLEPTGVVATAPQPTRGDGRSGRVADGGAASAIGAHPHDTVLMSTVRAEHAGIVLTLGVVLDDHDFMAYQGRLAFDQHALLMPGLLSIQAQGCAGEARLHEGPAVLSTLGRLLETLRRGSLGGALHSSTLRLGTATLEAAGQSVIVRDGTWQHTQPILDLVVAIQQLLDRFVEAAASANPAQRNNQRLIELLDHCEATSELVVRMVDTPAGEGMDGHDEDTAEEILDADAARFPYPVSLESLRMLQCDRIWEIECRAMGFWNLLVDTEHVLVPTEQELRSIALKDGALRWQTATEQTAELYRMERSSVLLLDGEQASLLTTADGKRRWSIGVPGGVASWLAQPVARVARGAATRVLIAAGTGWLLAFDCDTGAPAYTIACSHGEFVGFVMDGAVLVTATADGIIEAFHAWTGEHIWRVALRGEVVAAPIAAQGAVLLVHELPGGSATALCSIETRTGQRLWSQRLDTIEVSTARVSADLVIVSHDEHDRWEWVAIDVASGNERWRLIAPFESRDMESTFVDDPANGVMYVKSSGASVLCIGRDGTIRWHTRLPGFDSGSVMGELIYAEDVLVATHGTTYLLSARTGALVCAVDGIESDPTLLQLTPNFDLLVGSDSDDDDDRLCLHEARHFLAVVK